MLQIFWFFPEQCNLLSHPSHPSHELNKTGIREKWFHMQLEIVKNRSFNLLIFFKLTSRNAVVHNIAQFYHLQSPWYPTIKILDSGMGGKYNTHIYTSNKMLKKAYAVRHIWYLARDIHDSNKRCSRDITCFLSRQSEMWNTLCIHASLCT